MSMKRVWFGALVALVGCSGPVTTGKVGADKVWRNGNGKAVCPIMNIPIANEAKAAAKVEYGGVTYLLCCESCKFQYDQDHSIIERTRK